MKINIDKNYSHSPLLILFVAHILGLHGLDLPLPSSRLTLFSLLMRNLYTKKSGARCCNSTVDAMVLFFHCWAEINTQFSRLLNVLRDQTPFFTSLSLATSRSFIIIIIRLVNTRILLLERSSSFLNQNELESLLGMARLWLLVHNRIALLSRVHISSKQHIINNFNMPCSELSFFMWCCLVCCYTSSAFDEWNKFHTIAHTCFNNHFWFEQFTFYKKKYDRVKKNENFYAARCFILF